VMEGRGEAERKGGMEAGTEEWEERRREGGREGGRAGGRAEWREDAEEEEGGEAMQDLDDFRGGLTTLLHTLHQFNYLVCIIRVIFLVFF